MAGIDYILHYFRRLQDNNFDVSLLVSGEKGTGKSSSAIVLARRYVQLFGFTCPQCGNEFYKNLYSKKFTKDGEPYFEIPEYILNDKAWIQCPEDYKLNMKTHEREKISGCGFKFKYSQRKRIRWEARKFICYDNKSMLDLYFNAKPFSPIIADEAFQILGGQNHNKAENKYLKEVINNARPKKHIAFFLIPEAQWLDSKVREGFSSFWLRMIERGYGILFEKDKGESKDKYHVKELEGMFGTVKFFTNMEKIKTNVRKHPCYFDAFKFPELPAKIYDDYEIMRNTILLQRQVEEMVITNKDIAKIVAWNIMNQWDRIKIAIDRSKEVRPTYGLLTQEIFVDPLTRKAITSEPTLRSWIKGVDDYIKTKGSDVNIFEGQHEEKEPEPVQIVREEPKYEVTPQGDDMILL